MSLLQFLNKQMNIVLNAELHNVFQWHLLWQPWVAKCRLTWPV